MNVLIVDDAEINIRIYQSVLRKIPDLSFNTFTNSSEAIDWAMRNAADLALIDYSMPSLNGLEFIERFRRSSVNADCSVIMVTGETDLDVRYRALEIGANDFLVKPVDPIELGVRARNMLDLAQGRKKLANHADWLASEVRRATENIRNRELETINRLTRAAEFRDNETGMHILRMGHFCAIIGAAAGLLQDDVDMLLMAAPMHDIGKVATPDHILLKRGKLDPAEWEIMKQHTVAGFEILKESSSELLRSAAEIAIGHHEKYDGSGYPYGRKGEEIPVFARICAISDVFDALTSVRPYKSAWSFESAVDYILVRSATQFDPTLIQAFKRALPGIVEAKVRYPDIGAPTDHVAHIS